MVGSRFDSAGADAAACRRNIGASNVRSATFCAYPSGRRILNMDEPFTGGLQEFFLVPIQFEGGDDETWR